MTIRSLHCKLLITVLCSVSATVHANVLDDAVDAMRAGDFAEAYCIMMPLAEAGDADAQYNIGWMYLNGYGLRTNDRLALQWWEMASQQGHPDANLSIGMLYSLGDGDIARDLNKAIDYYLLAATEGQEDAVTILQSMMLRNDGAIRPRLQTIIAQHGVLFGDQYRVRADRLNARLEPSLESSIVATLLKGDLVLELQRRNRWSQVVIISDQKIDRTVWVYNPLLEKADADAESLETVNSQPQ